MARCGVNSRSGQSPAASPWRSSVSRDGRQAAPTAQWRTPVLPWHWRPESPAGAVGDRPSSARQCATASLLAFSLQFREPYPRSAGNSRLPRSALAAHFSHRPATGLLRWARREAEVRRAARASTAKRTQAAPIVSPDQHILRPGWRCAPQDSPSHLGIYCVPWRANDVRGDVDAKNCCVDLLAAG